MKWRAPGPIAANAARCHVRKRLQGRDVDSRLVLREALWAEG